jgi:pyruvate/2-oxoglutarate dehydrogenase complex dihydrolipoamide acyltransferase (E2) component
VKRHTQRPGYQVPQSEETITGATAEPTATATPASEPKAAPAAAATTASPAAAPASQAAKPTAPQKEKKGGLFASCCGGRGIDN